MVSSSGERSDCPWNHHRAQCSFRALKDAQQLDDLWIPPPSCSFLICDTVHEAQALRGVSSWSRKCPSLVGNLRQLPHALPRLGKKPAARKNRQFLLNHLQKGRMNLNRLNDQDSMNRGDFFIHFAFNR